MYVRTRSFFLILGLAAAALGGAAAPRAQRRQAPAPDSGARPKAAAVSFDGVVKPLLGRTCVPCHNDQLTSGNLDLGRFAAAGSIADNRDGWELILQKIRTGEMPPKGVRRPPAEELDAVVSYVQAELERA